MMAVWLKLKDSRLFWAVVACLAGILFGYSQRQDPPVQVIEKKIEDVESKQRLAEANELITSLKQQLVVANNTISELKTHVKTVIRIVKTKDGTTTIDKTTETNTESKTESKTDTKLDTNVDSKKTENKVTESGTKSHTETDTKITPTVRDSYYLGLSTQIGFDGMSRPGLEFKYRIIDLKTISLWGGTEVVVSDDLNILNTELRLQVGVSW